MKIITSTLVLLLLLASLPVSSQIAEKNLVKNFSVKGIHSVFLDAAGPVQVIVWNEDLLRLQLTVALQNGTETMLKSLVAAGRYNIDGQVNDHCLTIRASGLNKLVRTKNGQDLGEVIRWVVYAPANVTVSWNENKDVGYHIY